METQNELINVIDNATDSPLFNLDQLLPQYSPEFTESVANAISLLDQKEAQRSSKSLPIFTQDALKTVLTEQGRHAQTIAQIIYDYPHIFFKHPKSHYIFRNKPFLRECANLTEAAQCLELLIQAQLFDDDKFNHRNITKNAKNIGVLKNILEILNKSKLRLTVEELTWLTQDSDHLNTINFYLSKLYRPDLNHQTHINKNLWRKLQIYYNVFVIDDIKKIIERLLNYSDLNQEIYNIISKLYHYRHHAQSILLITLTLTQKFILECFNYTIINLRKEIQHDFTSETENKYKNLWLILYTYNFMLRNAPEDINTHLLTINGLIKDKKDKQENNNNNNNHNQPDNNNNQATDTNQAPLNQLFATIPTFNLTSEVAIYSLQKYFFNNQSLKTEKELNDFLKTLNTICEKGISFSLWQIIKPEMQNLLASANIPAQAINLDHFDFTSIKIKRSDFNLQKLIQPSNGYKEYCSGQAKQLIDCKGSFFANNSINKEQPIPETITLEGTTNSSFAALGWK